MRSATIERQHVLLDKLTEVLPPGKPVEGVSYPRIAEQIGVGSETLLRHKQLLERAGILDTKVTSAGKKGRSSTWMITKSGTEAHRALTRAISDETEGNVVIRPSQTVHKTGPEAENPWEILRSLRKDEAEALLEAARQYRSRADLLAQRIRELEDAGIHIDQSAIRWGTDERLETVALILPAVDSLQKQNEHLTELVRQWTDRSQPIVAERDELRRKYDAIKRQNERLLAERVNQTNGGQP